MLLYLLLCLFFLRACLAQGQIEAPKTCFVIRTYWAHGLSNGDGSLPLLLNSLKAQNIQNWEAHIVVLDNRPFPDIYNIIDKQEDDRISVFAYWLNQKYEPRDSGGRWTKGYHSLLYNLTDSAIYLGCSPDTKWVIITNGDNLYDENFLQTIADAPPGIDILAFDYYSRYQSVTENPCDRFAFKGSFAPSEDAPSNDDDDDGDDDDDKMRPDGDTSPLTTTPAVLPETPEVEVNRCKQNRFSICLTDVSANALNFARFVQEERGFGRIKDPTNLGLNDGLMATQLRDAGWKVLRLRNACLVNHAPSPQQCASLGRVWDDSVIDDIRHSAGRCVLPSEAAQKLGIPVADLTRAMKSDEALAEMMQLVDSGTSQRARSNHQQPQQDDGSVKSIALQHPRFHINSPYEVRRVHLAPFRRETRPREQQSSDVSSSTSSSSSPSDASVSTAESGRKLDDRAPRRPYRSRMDEGDFGYGMRGAVEGEENPGPGGVLRHPVLTCFRHRSLQRSILFQPYYCDDQNAAPVLSKNFS